MSRILITGAGGAIGRFLTEYMLKNTTYELVLNYFTSTEIPEYIENYRSRIKVVVGDITSKDILKEMFVDVDTLCHLASQVNPAAYGGDYDVAYKFGAGSTFAILDYIKNNNLNIHIIFPSSGGTVYSEIKETPHKETDLTYGASPYGIQKIMFENYLRLLSSTNENITCNVLRVSNPYGLSLNSGRKQGFIDVAISKILNNEKIEIWSPLDTTRDYIHIEDLSEAFVKTIEYKNDFEIFNIGSGVGTSLGDILRILGNKFGEFSTSV